MPSVLIPLMPVMPGEVVHPAVYNDMPALFCCNRKGADASVVSVAADTGVAYEAVEAQGEEYCREFSAPSVQTTHGLSAAASPALERGQHLQNQCWGRRVVFTLHDGQTTGVL